MRRDLTADLEPFRAWKGHAEGTLQLFSQDDIDKISSTNKNNIDRQTSHKIVALRIRVDNANRNVEASTIAFNTFISKIENPNRYRTITIPTRDAIIAGLNRKMMKYNHVLEQINEYNRILKDY